VAACIGGRAIWVRLAREPTKREGVVSKRLETSPQDPDDLNTPEVLVNLLKSVDGIRDLLQSENQRRVAKARREAELILSLAVLGVPVLITFSFRWSTWIPFIEHNPAPLLATATALFGLMWTLYQRPIWSHENWIRVLGLVCVASCIGIVVFFLTGTRPEWWNGSDLLTKLWISGLLILDAFFGASLAAGEAADLFDWLARQEADSSSR
jgi:hypothetical protein